MVTNAGELSCGYVIHAVGPKYDENDSETANQKMIQVIESKYFSASSLKFSFNLLFQSKLRNYFDFYFYRHFTTND